MVKQHPGIKVLSRDRSASYKSGMTERVVRTWGKGLNFEKMPECHKKTLAYALKALQTSGQKERSAETSGASLSQVA